MAGREQAVPEFDDLDWDAAQLGGDDRPAWRRLSPVLIGFGAFAVFLVTLWFVYDLRIAEGEYEPPLIRADTTPIKERPSDPGGMEVPNQDKLVYELLVPSPHPPRVEQLLPPPEEPMAKPLPPPEPAPTASADTATAAAPDPVPAEAAATEPAPAEGGEAAAAAPSWPPPPPPAKPDPVTLAKAPPPVKSPPPQASAAERKSAASAARIQLAAFRDAESAQAGWRSLAAKFPSVLANLAPQVVKVDLGSKGVFYRLQAGPFSSEDAARSVCGALKERRQDCWVVAGS